MTKDKEVFSLVIFDVVMLLWALIGIGEGLDDMSEMENRFQTILLIVTLLVGISFIYLKIKNPKASFKIYNLDRPHEAFKGKTPYEALRSCLE